MLQTQAVFDPVSLRRFIDVVKPDGVAILAGIIPLKSERTAPWLHANLPGVVVPPDMVAAMQNAGAAGRAAEECVALAARVIGEIKDICQGVHIMAIGLEAEVPAILRAAGVR
jgi:5,10-methylenetetrahydrofolate reductase